MEPIEILGLFAGAMAACSFFPQLRQTWRTRSTRDISLPAFIALAVGNYIWICYGALIGSTAILLTNIVTSVMITSMVYLKLKHG